VTIQRAVIRLAKETTKDQPDAGSIKYALLYIEAGLKVLERIPKGRNRGGFPNQVELWFILAAGLEASRDGEAFF
jgi:hypothetical protein